MRMNLTRDIDVVDKLPVAAQQSVIFNPGNRLPNPTTRNANAITHETSPLSTELPIVPLVWGPGKESKMNG
ncbi:MAG: hypothetical protein ACJAU6_003833 [Alphaproteobacteria bacterium]|jgi:hypothetical protein